MHHFTTTGGTMADDAKNKEAAAPAEPKRKMLTPAERVAKLEADLAAAKKAAEAKANKQVGELKTKRQALVDQVSERQAKIRDIDAQLKELGVDTAAPTIQSVKAG
jgi:hypothetical protein